MKKILTAVLAFTFVFGSSSAVVAVGETVGDSGRTWAIPNDYERGMHVQEFIDSFPGQSVSYLIDWDLAKNAFVDPTCKSISDSRCTSGRLSYSSVLPICGALSEVYCIEEFGIVNPTGESTKGVFARYFPNQPLNRFAAAEGLKLPYGATGSIFDIPTAPHEGGTLYYVSVLTQGDVDKQSGANLNKLDIQIYPVKLETGDAAINGDTDPGMSMETNGGSGHPVGQWRFAGFGFSGASFCVAGSVSEKMCAQRYAFPGDKKFFLKLKLQNRPKGWLHGRIAKPEVSFTETSSGYSFYMAANPVAVPVVYKMYRYPEMPQALKDQYDLKTGGYKPEVALRNPNPSGAPEGCGRSACTEDPMTRNVIIASSPSSKFGMDQLKLWLPFVQDKATTLLGTWSVRTLDENENQNASQCFKNGDKGVTGIVTTNATQYSAGPPSLNKGEGTLEYQVAAPHFTTKGEEFLGTYDLIMRSDVARCVYGFSAAPVRASLSVVNDKGDQKVATEILGEKNGWLYLSAGGFTYSSPTIKVKLEQDAPPPAPVPSATPTPSASSKPAVKAVTITCVKGKTSKKVTAVNPKCPTGYKKK